MRLFAAFLFTSAVLVSAGCHGQPIVNSGPKQPSVGGTIAGMVSASDSTVAVPGRKVTAVEVNTGSRYDSTTSANGGYTIQVPEGTYRVELELRSGETLTKKPEQTRVTNGDLDAGRDFVITVRAQAR